MADGSNVSLWPVVVGGLLTMAGGVIGGAITLIGKWMESGEEKKKRRAAKFEEFVSAIYEHEYWLNGVKNIRVYGEKGEITLSPISKVHAIASTHFPAFEKKVTDLISTARGWEMWMLRAGQLRLQGKVDSLNDGGLEAFQPYMLARDSLMDELRSFAQREFQ